MFCLRTVKCKICERSVTITQHLCNLIRFLFGIPRTWSQLKTTAGQVALQVLYSQCQLQRSFLAML